MAILRATVQLNRFSGLSEDAVTNVLHYRFDGSGDPVPLDTITNGVKGFYQAIQANLSPTLSPAANAHTIKYAWVTPGSIGPGDDTLSPVVREDRFTLATVGSTTTALPAEVACCVSLRCVGASAVPEETGSIRPRARLRGRIYVGPLGVNVLQQASNGEGQLSSAFITALRDAAKTHLHDTPAAALAMLAVYSRANASAPSVDTISVDNAFDIVRSRGQKPNQKVTVAA